MTLIEVIVTALLVVLIATAAATALISSARASADEQYRSQADSLAATDLDQLRGLSDAQLNALQTGSQTRQHQVTLGAVTYTVASTATYMSAVGSTTSGCTAAAGALYQIASKVSWTAEGRAQSLQNVSQLARPVAGDVVVQVNDSTGKALAGVTVSASGGSYQSTQTNSAGCGIFDGLTPGTYTFTFAKSGYVSVNGQSPSTQTVAVPSTGTTISYVLGQSSGAISASFGTQVSGAGATGETDGLSWITSGESVPGVSPSSGASTATTGTSSATLYPGTYQVWAGRCAGQEPPTGSVTGVNVGAGQSASVAVAEPMLNVQENYSYNGSVYGTVQPNDIWLTYRSNGCVDSWPATTIMGAQFIPADGWLVNPGQPYAASGTLTVCVDFAYNGNYYQGSAVTQNQNFSTSANANVVTVTIPYTPSNPSGPCTAQTS